MKKLSSGIVLFKFVGIKLFHDYSQAETAEEKQAIKVVARKSFADFDEEKYITNSELLSWIKKMKY